MIKSLQETYEIRTNVQIYLFCLILHNAVYMCLDNYILFQGVRIHFIMHRENK